MSHQPIREIRADMKRLLANLDERWIRAASKEISEALVDILRSREFCDCTNVLAWTSFFPGEVNLSLLISELSDERSFFLPRSNPDFSMDFVSIGRDWTQEVEPGGFGIPEPCYEAGELYDPARDAKKTVVLVPGLAFDLLGNRIGRGKGYYDRFLGQPAMREARLVGVCWNLQKMEKLYPEIHDVPMDYLCTEERFLACDGMREDERV